MFCTAQDVHPSKHHHLSSIHTTRQENNVQALKAVLKPYNLFCDNGKQLFNFMTKQVVRKETELSILSMEKRGNDAKDSFVNERICGSVNLWDPMKKVRLLNWDDLCKKIKLKSSAEEVQQKSTNALFSRLLAIGLSERHLDLQNTISDYEFNAIILFS